jgi:hypothetical protein
MGQPRTVELTPSEQSFIKSACTSMTDERILGQLNSQRIVGGLPVLTRSAIYRFRAKNNLIKTHGRRVNGLAAPRPAKRTAYEDFLARSPRVIPPE